MRCTRLRSQGSGDGVLMTPIRSGDHRIYGDKLKNVPTGLIIMKLNTIKEIILDVFNW